MTLSHSEMMKSARTVTALEMSALAVNLTLCMKISTMTDIQCRQCGSYIDEISTDSKGYPKCILCGWRCPVRLA